MENTQNKNGIALPGLVALVVSSAIGAGIFDLPRVLAGSATPGAAVVAWIITGVGITLLAVSLSQLAIKKPELEGVSDYARAGFGPFAGFISGWGYWLSAWLGNVAFATVLMSSLGFFFPSLISGNSVLAIAIASAISWILLWLVARGVESAAAINTIVTIAKLIPLFVFIVFGIIAFKFGVFTEHFWQNMSVNAKGLVSFEGATTAGLFEQIKGSLLTMVWLFVGIEGASMMASRAKKKSDAGRATIIGLISLLAIYMVISLLPYGVFTQAELVSMEKPALVNIFNSMVGTWGGALISVGLSISILGSWLSWTMLPVEATQLMTKQQLLPDWFGKTNKKNSPINSLIFTQILVQLFLITLIFTDEAYQFAYSLSTTAIIVSYAFVGAYQLKLGMITKSVSTMIIGLGTIAFEILTVAVSGLSFLWLCSLAYLVGFIFYVKAKKQHNQIITKSEMVMMSVISIAAIGAMFALAFGAIQI